MDVRPCDGCRHAKRCKAEPICCEAFVIYRRVGTAPERWASAPRQPSKEIHARAYAPIARGSPMFRKRVIEESES
jgi:hypothetical protein